MTKKTECFATFLTWQEFIQDIILPKLEVSSLNILNKKEKNEIYSFLYDNDIKEALKSLSLLFIALIRMSETTQYLKRT